MRYLHVTLIALFSASPALAQDDQVTASAIQLELNRMGCVAGKPDGIWGSGSKKALSKYASKAGEPDLELEPNNELLTKLRNERGRLCTLPPGIVAGADRQATAHLEAQKYSFKVWSTLPSKVATKKTEYGVLRCEAGSNSAPRKCSWQ